MGKGQEKPSLRRRTILHRPSAADTPDGAKGSDSHLRGPAGGHAAYIDPRRPGPQCGAADISVSLDPRGACLPGDGMWQAWPPGPTLQVGRGQLASELTADIGTCRLALMAGGGGGAMLSDLSLRSSGLGW